MLYSSNAFYEKKGSHGTPLLPFATYKTIIPEATHSYPMHWHDDIEIVMCWWGTCRYFVDFKDYILNPGDILIISPSLLHAFEQNNNSMYRGDTFVYSLSMIGTNDSDMCTRRIVTPLLNGEKIIQPHITPATPGYLSLRSNLERMVNCYNRHDESFEILLKSILLEFYYICDSNGLIKERKLPITYSGKYIKDIITYINIHYQHPITLDELAASVGVTPCHLSKIFKKTTGITCFEYINDIRLTKSYDEIVGSTNSILSIAIENGFNNISYFNRAFKKKYSCTPLECRNKSTS